MLRRFEALLNPTARSPEPPPTEGLWPFYWQFIRQVRPLVVALFLFGGLIAMLDVTIPAFIGRVVGMVSSHTPEALLRETWPQLATMAGVLLLVRPLVFMGHVVLVNQIVNPGLSNMVRWQNHWHVVRQSWTFFQNDFAGRIANRVLQTGPSLRESLVMSFDAAWYIVVYGSSALVLLASVDWRLTPPILLWFAGYGGLLCYFVPRLRERSRAVSEMRSNLTGRVVDSYTNILTVKLFSRARDEDAFVRESIDLHTDAFRNQTRMTTGYVVLLSLMNATLIVATATLAIWQWNSGRISVGSVAMVLPLTWQITNMAGWVARSVTSIFENIGTVQDGMRSIAVERQMPDPPDARELRVTRGEIRFENLHFDYGRVPYPGRGGVLHGIDLRIAPGERVGLVGPSGAGKSTLVNLLLHFYDPERGRIVIDGQDIASVTQESLRTQIAMVTQDTSLLHRSISENIRYGRPQATQAMIEDAARRAEAHAFIVGLEDWHGRHGYDAHVGERGVKLSGGQRQRVALARVILKDAPILVLDEATSALDSEVEAAIQSQLDGLMDGRTVIAIAHRLSTIARMDRLVVLDHGRIVESGTHAELLVHNGTYARLWHRQSGGFTPELLDVAAK
jgi:ATP-binding cassette subfamily B multidrug efflux pump